MQRTEYSMAYAVSSMENAVWRLQETGCRILPAFYCLLLIAYSLPLSLEPFKISCFVHCVLWVYCVAYGRRYRDFNSFPFHQPNKLNKLNEPYSPRTLIFYAPFQTSF